MHDNNFSLNPLSILFHDELDVENNFQTIACNWNNETYIKINPFGYKILRLIETQPNLPLAQIALKLKQKETVVRKFLEQMVQENIVFAK